MKDNSSICKMSSGREAPVETIEEMFKKFTEGNNALHRLLFVRSLLSVRLFVWEEEKLPRRIFAVSIENAIQNAAQKAAISCPVTARLSLVTFLKKRMDAIGETE